MWARCSCGSLEIDGKDCDETQTLATASYSNMAPFHFMQMALKTGSFGTETALDGIRKVSCKIERPQDVERFYAGQAGLKKEPIENDQVKISGSLESDYVATTLDDLHTSDGATSMVWEFVGPLIAATFYETFRITLLYHPPQRRAANRRRLRRRQTHVPVRGPLRRHQPAEDRDHLDRHHTVSPAWSRTSASSAPAS